MVLLPPALNTGGEKSFAKETGGQQVPGGMKDSQNPSPYIKHRSSLLNIQMP